MYPAKLVDVQNCSAKRMSNGDSLFQCWLGGRRVALHLVYGAVKRERLHILTDVGRQLRNLIDEGCSIFGW